MSATKSLSLDPQDAGAAAAAETFSARRPVPVSAPLKAERVQLTAESARARLKAERVQEKLQALPGWRLGAGARAIDRVRQFRDAASAAAFVVYLAQLAARAGQPVGIDLLGNVVAVTLWAKAEHGRSVGLNETVFNFARAIG